MPTFRLSSLQTTMGVHYVFFGGGEKNTGKIWRKFVNVKSCCLQVTKEASEVSVQVKGSRPEKEITVKRSEKSSVQISLQGQREGTYATRKRARKKKERSTPNKRKTSCWWVTHFDITKLFSVSHEICPKKSNQPQIFFTSHREASMD